MVDHFTDQIFLKQSLINKPSILLDFGKIFHPHPREILFKDPSQELWDRLGVILKHHSVVGGKALEYRGSSNDTINDDGRERHQLVVYGCLTRSRIFIQGRRY